jgi:hypothetical protein
MVSASFFDQLGNLSSINLVSIFMFPVPHGTKCIRDHVVETSLGVEKINWKRFYGTPNPFFLPFDLDFFLPLMDTCLARERLIG